MTPIPAGGLGLQASNYAMLVAAMVPALLLEAKKNNLLTRIFTQFFFQTLWQFRFYPFVSAPRGPFSHLAMSALSSFPLGRSSINPRSSGSDLDCSCIFQCTSCSQSCEVCS